MNRFFHVCAVLLVLFCCNYANSQNNKLCEPIVTSWSLADIKNKVPEGFNIYGKPDIVETVFGESLHFNGRNNVSVSAIPSFRYNT